MTLLAVLHLLPLYRLLDLYLLMSSLGYLLPTGTLIPIKLFTEIGCKEMVVEICEQFSAIGSNEEEQEERETTETEIGQRHKEEEARLVVEMHSLFVSSHLLQGSMSELTR